MENDVLAGLWTAHRMVDAIARLAVSQSPSGVCRTQPASVERDLLFLVYNCITGIGALARQ